MARLGHRWWSAVPAALAALGLLLVACGADRVETADPGYALATEKAAYQATEEAMANLTPESVHATEKSAYLATEEAMPKVTPKPKPTPLIAGPEVRPCVATDLATAIGSNAATGGQLLLGISLGNRSATECKISRLPDIEFLDGRQQALPITVTEDQSCPFSPCVFQQPILLLPGRGDFTPHVALQLGQASIMLAWHTYEGAGVCMTTPPNAKAVRLLLPDDGGALTVDVTSEFRAGIAPCHWPVEVLSYGPATPE